MRHVAYAVLVAMFVLAGNAGAHAGCEATRTRNATPSGTAEINEADVLYLPTPHPVVHAMLRLAGVTKNDIVFDLGSGDGRVPIAAARLHGARAVGIELDARLIRHSRCLAREAGVDMLVEFRQQDMFHTDLREATVVTLFLFPELNARLREKLLAEVRPGTRIVSHRFGLGDWPPESTIEVEGSRLMLWTAPER